MFVAQDPRRDPRFARSPQISLGTPFAFHSPWGREQGTTNRLAFQAAQYWLEKGWRVYLTDSVKIYAFDETKGKARSLPKGDCETFDAMLAAEISLFNPRLIIAIGAIAHRAV